VVGFSAPSDGPFLLRRRCLRKETREFATGRDLCYISASDERIFGYLRLAQITGTTYPRLCSVLRLIWAKTAYLGWPTKVRKLKERINGDHSRRENQHQSEEHRRSC